jgi:putative NADH-flavin reductase
MNIIIFGASGRTGRELVKQAIEHGHVVTAFVRSVSRLPMQHKNLQVVEGDVKNYEQVRVALAGKDVVISALGVSKTLHHDPVVVEGIRNIVKAMITEKVSRLIYQSTFLVDVEHQSYNFFVKRILSYILRREARDHQEKESAVREGITEFTIVRPGRLTDGLFTGNYRHGESIPAIAFLPSVSRADVADFMVRQINDNRYLNKTVTVME